MTDTMTDERALNLLLATSLGSSLSLNKALREAHDHIAARLAQTAGVPDGWQIVPKVLDVAMFCAWTATSSWTKSSPASYQVAYAAMLAAAPAQEAK